MQTIGNIKADGRPVFGQHVKDMVKLVMDISPECFIVPAHVWTPWFSLFGANSGFDSVEECFQEQSKHIYCMETGLSSDPEMNWRLSALDKITLISNSDAHSPRRLGREANVFDCNLDYSEIIDVLKTNDTKRFLYTVEFFPQEGKYHYDGHRNCQVVLNPSESAKHKDICPVCKKRLTIGVMHRIAALADRPEGFTPPNKPKTIHLVPFVEIIAEALGFGAESASVKTEYEKLIKQGKNEFNILLNLSLDELAEFMPQRIVEGIKLVREGKLSISPGHDGVYGKINIFGKKSPTKSLLASEEDSTPAFNERNKIPSQMRLF